jgi:hypothetical protein
MIKEQHKDFLCRYGSANHLDKMIDRDSFFNTIKKNPMLQPHHINKIISNRAMNQSFVADLMEHPNSDKSNVDHIISQSKKNDSCLGKLGSDTRIKIRAALDHPTSTEEHWHDVIDHAHSDLITNIVERSRKNIPDSIYARLSDHPDDDIRASLATSYKSPDHILKKLSSDENPAVASYARSNYKERHCL